MLFDIYARLQCPHCLTISNDHLCSNFKVKDSGFSECNHTCKNCGATDSEYDGSKPFSKCNVQFIDSANYESYDYDPSEMQKSEKKIKELKIELNQLENYVNKCNAHYADLWQTTEDR